MMIDGFKYFMFPVNFSATFGLLLNTFEDSWELIKTCLILNKLFIKRVAERKVEANSPVIESNVSTIVYGNN